jgi:ring-1,2-phenylacetyl-CoA epoxidase subunit PaaC
MGDELAPPLFEYLLRLGAWIGRGPALEEDIASANVGLDLLGQARLWLQYAGEVEARFRPRGRSEDELAFLRDGHDFRNLLLCEQPNGDYAMTVARQLLFDHAHLMLLDRLAGSADARVAAIAAKAHKEVRYHVERSSGWVVRLGDGTDASHARMQRALDALWPYTGELFEADDVDRTLAAAGIAPDPVTLAAPWREAVVAVLDEATLRLPEVSWMHGGGRGGRQGRHTEHLGHLLAEMQFLQRAYPGLQW